MNFPFGASKKTTFAILGSAKSVFSCQLPSSSLLLAQFNALAMYVVYWELMNKVMANS
jgi:hypothetical protein